MTAKELREKYERDLKELQDNCPHTEVSEWTSLQWAPGHFGLPVKYCLNCEKIVGTQTFHEA